MQSAAPPAPTRTSHRRRNLGLGVIALLVVLGIIGAVGGKPGASTPPASAAAVAVNAPPATNTSPAGAPSAPAAAGSGDNLCGAVSQDQIKSITGTAPLPGGTSGINEGGIRSCTWVLNFSPSKVVGVMLYASAENFDPTFPGAQSVSGVGDAAYWVSALNGLSVKVGTRELTVTVVDPDVDTQSAAVAIAQATIPHLP